VSVRLPTPAPRSSCGEFTGGRWCRSMARTKTHDSPTTPPVPVVPLPCWQDATRPGLACPTSAHRRPCTSLTTRSGGAFGRSIHQRASRRSSSFRDRNSHRQRKW
jgi:hypothetical protein